ncbi:MAG: IS481 family transposase, partial [Gammaproteobacteria bacterium]
MSHDSHHRERDRWARLRFSIIGPLLAAPPGPGELHEALTELAEKSWRHPITGAPI